MKHKTLTHCLKLFDGFDGYVKVIDPNWVAIFTNMKQTKADRKTPFSSKLYHTNLYYLYFKGKCYMIRSGVLIAVDT